MRTGCMLRTGGARGVSLKENRVQAENRECPWSQSKGEPGASREQGVPVESV